MIIRIAACIGFNTATFLRVVKFSIIILAGIHSILAIIIPSTPENKPIINVSALKTRVISFFLAPSDLKIPISFVLSRTLIYIIIPIIIDETIRDIAEKAIKTMVIASIILPDKVVIDLA